jgi:hypothetical protein
VGKIKKMIRKRLLWPMVSGGVAWVAGIAADRMLHASLHRARGDRRHGTLARSAATAALAGTAELLAMRGTAYALSRLGWKRKKGKKH